MDEKAPRRWRRVLLISAASVVGVAFAVILVARGFIATGEIPPSRLLPPPGMPKLMPARANSATSKSASASPQKPMVVRSGETSATAHTIYSNWRRRYDESRNEFARIWYVPRKTYFTAEQKRWLEAHHDWMDDLMKVAAAGGPPKMTCEMAAALGDEGLDRYPWPYSTPLHSDEALIFAIESKLRRDKGDFSGAADALMAIGVFAEARAEPFLGDYSESLTIRHARDFQLLEWIQQSPPPPDVARRLIDRLTAEAAAVRDFRPFLELEYRRERYRKVQQLSRSYSQVFQDEYNRGRGGMNGPVYFWNVFDDFRDGPFGTIGNCSGSAITSTVYKSGAKSSLKRFDETWTGYFAEISKKPKGEIPNGLFYGITGEAIADQRRNIKTFENLILTALDSVVERAGGPKGPVRIDFYENKPVKIVNETTSTLIYSIGPDQTDEHGTVVYDPTNGTMSKGDIIILCVPMTKKAN